jgi:hypothetical protein
MSSANLRINRPVGFLPYFFTPAFQSSPPIIENALRKQVKLLPNDKL